MKIHDLQGRTLIKGGAPGKSQPSTGTDFQHLLDDRLRSIGETKKTAQVTGTSLDRATPVALRLESLALTETTIDTLSAYSSALGNTELSVTDFEPLVSALEEKTVGLLEMKNKLSGDDPLAQLLERVSTVAYLETAKYRRGDYEG